MVVSPVESVVSRVVVELVVGSTVVVEVAVWEVDVVGSTGSVLAVLGSSMVEVASVLAEDGEVLVGSDMRLVTPGLPLSSPLAQPKGLYFPQLLLIPQLSSAKGASSGRMRTSMALQVIFAQTKLARKGCLGWCGAVRGRTIAVPGAR